MLPSAWPAPRAPPRPLEPDKVAVTDRSALCPAIAATAPIARIVAVSFDGSRRKSPNVLSKRPANDGETQTAPAGAGDRDSVAVGSIWSNVWDAAGAAVTASTTAAMYEQYRVERI